MASAETLFLDAATDPDAWQAALDSIVQRTNSQGAALLTVEGRGPFVLPTEAMGEVAERYIAEGWHQRDFRYAGIPIMKKRGVFVDQDIIQPEQMRRMDYYADFLQPMGFGWFAGLKIDTGDDLWCLTLQRGVHRGAYQVEEQRRLVRLGRVVSRAAALARRLEFARLDGAVDVAEALSDAALFIDRFGKVIRLNRAAEAMVGSRFMIRQGQIYFADTSSEALHRHIAAAIWPAIGPAAAALLPVVVPQPYGRPLVFRAIRLLGRSLGFFAPAYVMLLVADLDQRPSARTEDLQVIFRLTAAEARLANALSRGFTLVDAATYLNCAHETLRTQLKSVFAKTGARTQSQLIDLLGIIRRI